MSEQKLVYGVGINDSTYKVTKNAFVNGIYKQIWICPFYLAWKDMLKRCYSTKRLAKFPTYKGCHVVTEWKTFSEFRAWMIAQPWDGNHLDKDILFVDNKVYGPKTCVFLQPQINTFITDGGSAGGKWPVGVSFNSLTKRFQARCSNPVTGKFEHIGYFQDSEKAHDAWRRRKHEIACAYADNQTDPRIANALRTRYLKVV